MACWNEDRCGVDGGGGGASGGGMGVGTYCNDALTSCMDRLTWVGTATMSVLAPAGTKQQMPRCPSDGLGQDGLDRARNGS